jgi:hypothetical protein
MKNSIFLLVSLIPNIWFVPNIAFADKISYLNYVCPLEKLIDALEIVESSGRADAVGDNGKAVGILQIQPIMIAEVNRIIKLNKINYEFTLADRYCRNKSRDIANIVFRHYIPIIIRERGYYSYQDLARIWNGGGNAWREQAGQKEINLKNYWKKVERELKKR